MREKTGKRIRILSVVLLAVSALVLWETHRLVPFMMDDLWYSTLLYEDTPITSLADIVRSQIWHYYNWGGRSMTHAILQLTLLAGENAADVCNVLFTFLLAWIICVVAENRKAAALFAAVGMLLGLNANWKMSMFWQAGAANYLYITVFILLFVFCYVRELPEDGAQDSLKALPGISLWIVPLGVLAGWSNENMGPAVWLLSVAVIVLNRRKGRSTPVWMFTGSLSCLAGSIVMIAAPGNFVRSAEVPENQYGLLWRCFLRGYAESRGVLEYLFPTLSCPHPEGDIARTARQAQRAAALLRAAFVGGDGAFTALPRQGCLRDDGAFNMRYPLTCGKDTAGKKGACVAAVWHGGACVA